MLVSENLRRQMPALPEQFREGSAKSITFCLTENCNFACKYCYLVNFDHKKKLTKEQALKNIDFVFDNPNLFQEDSVIWEFIGGEPLLEVELMDYMCDVLKLKMWERRPDWMENHMFNLATNGSLYHKPNVRRFIEKNRERLSLGFSIDGNKILHDGARVYPDGRGTFEDVVKNIDLYKSDFGTRSSTKSTLARESLPHIFDSVKYLFSLDLIVYMNTVFEDCWLPGDDTLFYDQLVKLADWMIESGKWKTNYVSLFDFRFVDNSLKLSNNNWCGSGKMLHISTDGKFYPCTRLAPYSMQYRKEGFEIGDIVNGYNYEKVSAFLNLTKVDQSCSTCMNCEAESGCAWCTGWNYDKYGSIFKRATAICSMHKARVLANQYYYGKLEKLYGDSADKR